MSKTGINVKLSDTTLGVSVANEGVALIVYAVTAVTGAKSPYLFTSESEYVSTVAALTAPEKALFDVHLTGMVQKFYQKAGAGAKLWISFVAGTGDYITPNIQKIQDIVFATIANKWDNRPRLIGFCNSAVATVPASSALPATTAKMLEAAQTLCNNLFVESFRTCAILAEDCGSKYMLTSTANIPNVQTLYAAGAPSVALLLTTTLTDGATVPKPLKDVGEALGMLYNMNPAQSIGNMQLPAAANTAYFNDATDITNVSVLTLSQLDDMGSNQLLFHRTRKGRSGVYYNDGATANDSTKALSKIEFVRVANGVCDDAEAFFQGLINTQVPVTNSGAIQAGYVASVLNEFNVRYVDPRISRGDASAISVSLEAKGGNFIVSRAFAVTVKILPSPNMEQAFVNVFYVSQL